MAAHAISTVDPYMPRELPGCDAPVLAALPVHSTAPFAGVRSVQRLPRNDDGKVAIKYDVLEMNIHARQAVQ
jgi:hypothetical protein